MLALRDGDVMEEGVERDILADEERTGLDGVIDSARSFHNDGHHYTFSSKVSPYDLIVSTPLPLSRHNSPDTPASSHRLPCHPRYFLSLQVRS